MKINSIKDFDKCLSSLGYTEVGGYPIYFVTKDGKCLCFETVAKEYERIKDAILHEMDNGWRVIASDVNWGDKIYCSISGDEIESVFETRD